MIYHSYSRYLKEKYGEAVYRVAIDAGFGCPHRFNSRLKGGCIFCDEDGSRAVYHQKLKEVKSLEVNFKKEKEGFCAWSPQWVESQVDKSIQFLQRRYDARKFLLYFQAFSNTYAPCHQLKIIYDHALSLANFRELIVSTRPDCLNHEKVDLLASYANDDFDVWCELGLQTASNRLLKILKRGHSVEQFIESFSLLREKKIKIAVHLITGLPWETDEERATTLNLMQKLKPEGVKIHNLNIVYGTELYELWKKDSFFIAGMEDHLETLIYYIRRLPSEIVMMRMTCDTDREKLVLPEKWNKIRLLQRLEKRMKENGWTQGDLVPFSLNP